MSLPTIIAIDGPAASGKTTLGQKLAENLGYLLFDTGILYRAVTWAALQRLLDVNDEATIAELAANINIDVEPPSQEDGRGYDVLVDGLDITWEIRKPEVDANVSIVSANPSVRQALSAQQRRIGLRGQVVMVGRDIGTVVLPEAGLKIFLEASAEERARRRYQEILHRDQNGNYQEILAAIRDRDRIDSSREVAPLRPAEDALIVDTDHLDAGQVLEWVKQKMAAAAKQDQFSNPERLDAQQRPGLNQ